MGFRGSGFRVLSLYVILRMNSAECHTAQAVSLSSPFFISSIIYSFPHYLSRNILIHKICSKESLNFEIPDVYMRAASKISASADLAEVQALSKLPTPYTCKPNTSGSDEPILTTPD